LEYADIQRIKLGCAAIGAITLIAAASRLGVDGVVIGSMLGVLPPTLFQLNKTLSKPNVILEDVYVTEYPGRWYVFGTDRDDVKAMNSICLHAELKNTGSRTAEDCSIKLQSPDFSSQKYHTRWSNSNFVTRDLSPGEKQTVDLLWITLDKQKVKTAKPMRKGDNEEHFPPGSYEKTTRHELKGRNCSMDVLIEAVNMPLRKERVKIGGKEDLKIPEDIIENCQEWDVITNIKSGYESYIVYYNRQGKEELELPRDLRLNMLKEFEQFKPANIAMKSSERYEEAVDRIFKIDRDGD
jgi:hypothetical protein